MGATAKVFGNPAHPYTRMLLTSVPHVTEKWDVAASVPDPHGSTDDDGDRPLQKLDDDHFAAV